MTERSRFQITISVLLRTVLCLSAAVLTLSAESAGQKNSFVKFEWGSGDVAGKRSGKSSILVPVKVNGSNRQFYCQLDTGCDMCLLNGGILAQYGVPVDTTVMAFHHFSLIGSSDSSFDFPCSAFVDWSTDYVVDTSSTKPRDNIIGTVGFDPFTERILVIDFPNRSYGVFSDSAELPVALKRSVEYVPAQVKDRKFRVSVVIGGDTLTNVLFDTGASETTLTLPLADWRRATGLIGTERSVWTGTVLSWGQDLKIIRARAKGDLEFGSVRVAAPMVDHVEWADPAFANLRLIGNAPFYHDNTVVVDAKNNRMGVTKK